jgi:PhzF family phenazine biosynthesis protein
MKWLTTKMVSTFTDTAYSGNPAWVVTGVDPDEQDAKLLRLASELNPVSDTVFVFPGDNECELKLRFFSRSEEINFSGHGTIAAYYAIEDQNLVRFTEPVCMIRQKTKSGVQSIELRLTKGRIRRVTVSLAVPQFISSPLDIKQIARFLGIPPVAITGTHQPLGVVTFSGCTEIIVPVDTCDTMLHIQPGFSVMKNFCDRMQFTGVVAYCMKTIEKDNTAHIRHFAPSVGIDEDPVSGAASAAVGAFLVNNRLIPVEETTRLIIEQGHAIQRPGIVYVHIHTYKNQILKVTFGGQGVIAFDGRIKLPE